MIYIKRLIVILNLIALVIPPPIFRGQSIRLRAQESTSNESSVTRDIGETEDEPFDNFEPDNPLNALAWGDSIQANFEAVNAPLEPSSVKVSGADILEAREGQVDWRVEWMIRYLKRKHPDHLRIERIKKGYLTERRQFSRDTPIEENDQAPISAHYYGQAFKISEIDKESICETKTLTGTKKTPPQPIKVAWQTKEGMARAGDAPPLDTLSYDSLITSVGGDFIRQALGEVADYYLPNMPGADFSLGRIIGFSGKTALSENGYLPPPPSGMTLGSPVGMTIWAGQYALAQALNNQIAPSGFVGQDRSQFLKNSALSFLEQQLKLPEGGLRGKNINELLANLGKRHLEQLAGANTGEFSGEIKIWIGKFDKLTSRYQATSGRSQAEATDLAFNLPKNTTSRLRNNDVKGLQMIGAKVLGESTKMNEKYLNDFISHVANKNRVDPIDLIPLVGVELPAGIGYTDLKKVFSNDPDRDKALENIGETALKSYLTKNPLFRNSALGVSSDRLIRVIEGKDKPIDFITEVGSNYLETSLGLPTNAIKNTLLDMKEQKQLENFFVYKDDDVNGLYDYYDNPQYYQDSNDNSMPDLFESGAAKDNNTSTLTLFLRNIGRESLKDRGENPNNYINLQLENAGTQYLLKNISQTMNLDLEIKGIKINPFDVVKYLSGDTESIVKKAGGELLDQATQSLGGSALSALKNNIKADDLMSSSILKQLGKLAGISSDERSVYTTADDRFIDKDGNGYPDFYDDPRYNEDRNGNGLADAFDSQYSYDIDPNQDGIPDKGQNAITKNNKQLAEKLVGFADKFVNVNELLGIDKTTYGEIKTTDLVNALKNKDYKSLATVAGYALDSKGLLKPGTFADLINNPHNRPQILLDAATEQLATMVGLTGDSSGSLRAIYEEGRISFTFDIDKLPKNSVQWKIAALIAQQTKIIKTTGGAGDLIPHQDIAKFVNGQTNQAFAAWGMAAYVDEVNKDNPFGNNYKLTYDEVSNAWFGNSQTEQSAINTAIDQRVSDLNAKGETASPDPNDPVNRELADDTVNKLRYDSRQNLYAKTLDIEIRKTTGVPIQPGFGKAMLYGTEQERLSALTSTGVVFALDELGIDTDQQLSDKLGGFPVISGTINLFQQLGGGKISFSQFQDELKRMYSNPTELAQKFVANQIIDDQKLAQITGIDILPGTSDLIIQWAFDKSGNFDRLKEALQAKYSTDFLIFEASKFMDKVAGFQLGSTYQLYSMYQQYQAFYNAYLTTTQQYTLGHPAITQAKANFHAQTAVLVVQAIDLITGGAITKLTSPLDKALGLPPGTVLNVALALIAGNPVGAAIVLAMAILGFGKTKCKDITELAQGKIHQLLSEVLDIAKQETALYGTIHDSDFSYNYSLIPQQLITWGDYNLYPSQHGFPDWIKDLLPIADDVYNPVIPGTSSRRSSIPGVYENVGFFPLETMWDNVHIGW